MRLRTRAIEYTRIRDLANIPTKLKEADPSHFVETFQNFPLGKGIPLEYSTATLTALLVNREGDSFITKKVNHAEATLLGKAGFVSEVQGSAKVWKRRLR